MLKSNIEYYLKFFFYLIQLTMHNCKTLTTATSQFPPIHIINSNEHPALFKIYPLAAVFPKRYRQSRNIRPVLMVYYII